MILPAALLSMTVPTVQATGGARPAMPLRPLVELISPEDYPVDAIIRNAEGRTRFQLAIDEKGAPYGCRILESAREPSLDRATCDIFMARAKFQPAIDAKGQPVPDTYANVVDWRLPEAAGGVIPFEPIRTVVTVYSTAEGVSHCEMRENDFKWPRLSRDQCVSMANREMVDLAEYHKTPSTITLVTTFSPHGPPAPTEEQADGLLALEAMATVQIGTDGRVTFCQTLGFNTAMDLPRQATEPDICEDFGLRDLMFPPTGGPGDARSARWTVRLYITPRLADGKRPQGTP